jgi:hypothetical protein
MGPPLRGPSSSRLVKSACSGRQSSQASEPQIWSLDEFEFAAPRPDPVEISYKGSGKLKGMKAVLTGGDSGIVRVVAIAFAREGADVHLGRGMATDLPDQYLLDVLPD